MKKILAVLIVFLAAAGAYALRSEKGEVPPAPPSPAAQKPSSLPSPSSLALFPESPFRKPLPDDAPIDPRSGEFVEGLSRAGDFVITYRQYSVPVYIADETTPRIDIPLPCGKRWELGVSALKSVPVPAWAEAAFDADGADNPPKGCGEDADQDNAMAIIDPVRRCEYDLWQARREGGTWMASWGNAISLDGSGVYEKGFSARGSGFALTLGMIFPDELARGEINHALIFSYPFTKSGGPVPPASESDGESEEEFALPEGARLRLKKDFDASGLAPYEKTIARALQKYGMVLADNGGDSGVALYAVDPKSVSENPYEGMFPDEDYIPLSIPLDAFEVVALPPQRENPQEFAVSDPQCAAFSKNRH